MRDQGDFSILSNSHQRFTVSDLLYCIGHTYPCPCVPSQEECREMYCIGHTYPCPCVPSQEECREMYRIGRTYPCPCVPSQEECREMYCIGHTYPCPCVPSQEECREMLNAHKEEIYRHMEGSHVGSHNGSITSSSPQMSSISLRPLHGGSFSAPPSSRNRALVLDGQTMGYILTDSRMRGSLLEVVKCCKSVLCCRATPLQKVRACAAHDPSC